MVGLFLESNQSIKIDNKLMKFFDNYYESHGSYHPELSLSQIHPVTSSL